MDIEEEVERAVQEFNRYRSPEARAQVMSISENGSIGISFTGTFCKSCGYHDYFDDFSVVLEEMGMESEMGSIRELDEGGAVVEFFLHEKPG